MVAGSTAAMLANPTRWGQIGWPAAISNFANWERRLRYRGYGVGARGKFFPLFELQFRNR